MAFRKAKTSETLQYRNIPTRLWSLFILLAVFEPLRTCIRRWRIRLPWSRSRVRSRDMSCQPMYLCTPHTLCMCHSDISGTTGDTNSLSFYKPTSLSTTSAVPSYGCWHKTAKYDIATFRQGVATGSEERGRRATVTNCGFAYRSSQARSSSGLGIAKTIETSSRALQAHAGSGPAPRGVMLSYNQGPLLVHEPFGRYKWARDGGFPRSCLKVVVLGRRSPSVCS